MSDPVVDWMQGPAFFVLSSGRCGTMTLAHIFALAPNGRVWHHPEPLLVSETLDAYLGRGDDTEVFRAARGHLIKGAWLEGLVHGETDHNMTAFAPTIAELMPQARFLVAIRHPAPFVRSGMRRGWYEGHSWDHGRLRPSPEQPIAAQWDRLPTFEKICWLWAETYRRILHIYETLPADRRALLRFEDLVGRRVDWRALFDFLGLTFPGSGPIEEILDQRLNRQEKGEFPTADAWSEAQRSTLVAYCGAIGAAFGVEVEAEGA